MQSAAKLTQTTETQDDPQDLTPVKILKTEAKKKIETHAPKPWPFEDMATKLVIAGSTVMLTAAEARIAILMFDYDFRGFNSTRNLGAGPFDPILPYTIGVGAISYGIAVIGFAMLTKPSWGTVRKVGAFAAAQLATTLGIMIVTGIVVFFVRTFSDITGAPAIEAAAEITVAIMVLLAGGCLLGNYELAKNWIEQFAEPAPFVYTPSQTTTAAEPVVYDNILD